MNETRVRDLEMEQDLPFQHRSWRLQRIAWAAMGMVVLAALIGLFGKGPLSHATAEAEGGSLKIEYERFGRYESPSLLHVYYGGPVESDGTARVSIDRTYLRHVRIDGITPRPESEEVSASGVVYIFRVTMLQEPAVFSFVFTPQRLGFISGAVRLNAHHAVTFRQFVYP